MLLKNNPLQFAPFSRSTLSISRAKRHNVAEKGKAKQKALHVAVILSQAVGRWKWSFKKKTSTILQRKRRRDRAQGATHEVTHLENVSRSLWDIRAFHRHWAGTTGTANSHVRCNPSSV